MWTYSQPLTIPYAFGAISFITAADTYPIKPPPRLGYGRVEDIHVRATVIFTQVTTPAFVRVGIPANHLKYAELNMGAAAAGAAYNIRDVATLLPIKSNINLAADGVSVVDIRIVAPTGGSPTGTGYLDVVISWWT